ncbi:hypothetical protein CYANOKiyG1_59560 [Okeania sp. KiyG1]|nr:hypothetical protein CYANOKiyG1_59560 [Okeania sp. KiyG1]
MAEVFPGKAFVLHLLFLSVIFCLEVCIFFAPDVLNIYYLCICKIHNIHDTNQTEFLMIGHKIKDGSYISGQISLTLDKSLLIG